MDVFVRLGFVYRDVIEAELSVHECYWEAELVYMDVIWRQSFVYIDVMGR